MSSDFRICGAGLLAAQDVLILCVVSAAAQLGGGWSDIRGGERIAGGPCLHSEGAEVKHGLRLPGAVYPAPTRAFSPAMRA